MSFGKFQAISVGRKTKDSNIDFNINNFTIQCDEEVILLGVTIDFRLNFDKHVSNICKKSIKATKCTQKNWEIFV